MDGIKFILVLVLPDPHTFGILILLSYIFIRKQTLMNIIYSIHIRSK